MKIPAATPLLNANGFELIPYCLDHDTQTVLWLNDPRMQSSFGLSRKVTVPSHRTWIDSNEEVMIWAITEGQTHLGNILLHLELNRGSAYLQVYLGEVSSRSRGVGGRVMECVLDFAFKKLELHRIWLHTLPGNEAAEALYTKVGFVREGIERDGLLRDGEFSDQYRWSLLADEWGNRVNRDSK